RHLLRDARGMREPERRQRHAEAEPDALGHLRKRAEQHLRRGAVRAPLAEMMLHRPDRVEAEPIRELDLLNRLVVGASLALALAPGMWLPPRLRRVDFVEQVELHRLLPRSGHVVGKARAGAAVHDERLTRDAVRERRGQEYRR